MGNEGIFLFNYSFYYVSLSDGDAAMRIRFIQSLKYASAQPDKVQKSHKYSNNASAYISLSFIMDGENKGNLFINKDFCIENTTVFSIAFDGTHCKKLLSDAGLNIEKMTDMIKINNFDKIEKIYDELLEMYPEDADLEMPVILSQITAKSFFYRILRIIEVNCQKPIKSEKRVLLVKAESYMRNNFTNGCTIEGLSKHLSVDRRYLYKLFKNYSGISPKQYLSNIKISYACDLLLNTDLSIGDIAEKTGYSDMLQFSAFFKKQTGMSPMKYRTYNV